jgi:two-component system, OmpR family, sensor kinase
VRLRTRLLVSVTAVTAAVLVASFVPLYILVDAAETRDLDHALVRHAYAAAQRLPARLERGAPLDPGWIRVPESLDPATRYLAVYDVGGAVLAASANFAGNVPTLEELGVSEVAWEGTSLDLSLGEAILRGVIIPVPTRDEYLLYAASQRSIDDDTKFLYRVLLLLFVLATLATSLIARWVGERLARDVHVIARVARTVAEGDFDVRIGADARGSDDTRTLAADLDHMISQLGELVRTQRTFISHAAHELRSPLATLLGELQLALRRPREAAAYRAALEQMRGDVETLAHLTEDLLLLARLQADAAPAHESIRVETAVLEALRMARGRAEARDVQVEVHGLDAAHHIEVRAVRGELARLLRNLIDNAVTHSPHGGTVQVTVAVHRHLELAVVDAGPGVAPEDRPQIFAPFFRGERGAHSQADGTGLGLSIARTIAQSGGGDLYLDESYTGGARFVVQLPLVDPRAPSV